MVLNPEGAIRQGESGGDIKRLPSGSAAEVKEDAWKFFSYAPAISVGA
jgi:hypothetical protein